MLQDIKVSNAPERLKVMGEDIFKLYSSPKEENSIAKGIPKVWLKLLYQYSKHVKSLRFKYRGNSIKGVYRRPTSFCHIGHATTFAVYTR
jgi:transcription elongation factor GreA-like protein